MADGAPSVLIVRVRLVLASMRVTVPSLRLLTHAVPGVNAMSCGSFPTLIGGPTTSPATSLFLSPLFVTLPMMASAMKITMSVAPTTITHSAHVGSRLRGRAGGGAGAPPPPPAGSAAPVGAGGVQGPGGDGGGAGGAGGAVTAGKPEGGVSPTAPGGAGAGEAGPAAGGPACAR